MRIYLHRTLASAVSPAMAIPRCSSIAKICKQPIFPRRRATQTDGGNDLPLVVRKIRSRSLQGGQHRVSSRAHANRSAALFDSFHRVLNLVQPALRAPSDDICVVLHSNNTSCPESTEQHLREPGIGSRRAAADRKWSQNASRMDTPESRPMCQEGHAR